MSVRVSLLRLIRVDTLRRVHSVGFLAGRLNYILPQTNSCNGSFQNSVAEQLIAQTSNQYCCYAVSLKWFYQRIAFHNKPLSIIEYISSA